MNSSSIRTIGLMSGTSMDGLDIAVVDVMPHSSGLTPHLINSTTVTFPVDLKQKISSAVQGDETLYKPLDDELGHWMAKTVSKVISDMGISDIDLISSHGQTVYHENGVKSIQVGDPQYLANVFQVPVIYDFRSADIDAGGTGAPLIPKVDEWLFQDSESSVMTINIGGIANVTFIPPKGQGTIVGFDTGPGMALLDEIFQTHFIEGYDEGGTLAKKGAMNKELVDRWMKDPFIQMMPPKSTGRATYGRSWIQSHEVELDELSFEDRLATLANFTGRSIFRACKSFLKDDNISSCFVSGGGSHHNEIMFHLKRYFYPTPVKLSDQIDIPVDMKEAIGFALLGVAHIKNIPGNIPSVTGANKEVVLGKKVKPIIL